MKQRFGLILALSFLVAAAGFAQGTGTTSSLSGTVTTGGTPLPGATVTITSPALQGARTDVTGSGGGYNFGALPPGPYTVTVELEGLQKVVRKTTLALAQSSRVDADLKVSSVSEAITVTASAPAVLETTEVSRNFSQKEINDLPVRRNVRDTVLLAPGVNSNGPNNQISISGGPSYDNLFLVNGVVVNENLRGQPHNLFIEDAIQETTVLTGGISSEYGRFTGGVVSTLTKSGGNTFTGSLRDSLTNPKWISKSAFVAANGTREADHPNKISSIYEGTLGGFLLRDRLWFFGAGRYTKGAPANGFNALSSTLSPVPITFLNTVDEKRYETKLTGQITPKHTLIGSYLKVQQTENNNFFGSIYDASSIVAQRQLPNSLQAASYNGVLTSNFLVEAFASRKKFAFIKSGGIYTDRIKGTWISDPTARFNAPVFCGVCTPEQRNNESQELKTSFYKNTKSLGNHNLVVGAENFKEVRIVNNYQSASQFQVTTTSKANFLPGDPTPYPHFNSGTRIVYRPILALSQGDDLRTRSFFINDKIDWNSRWQFNVGVRYDKNHIVDASGNLVSKDSKFSPRLGAIWDIAGNGRTRVNVNYATYVTKIVDGNVGGAGNNAGTPAQFSFRYNGPVVNPVDASGNIIGTPVNPQAALGILFAWLDSQGGVNMDPKSPLRTVTFYPGYSQRVLNSIKSPSVNEIAVGLGQQFARNAFVRLDLINRKWKDFYALELDQKTGTLANPTGGVGDLAILINDNSIKRKYEAAQLNFGYQPGSWNFGGGYTYAKLRGSDGTESDGSASSPNTPLGLYYPEVLGYGNRVPAGYIQGDQRHRAKVWAGRDVNLPIGIVNLSVIQSADSGRAYSAVGTIDIASVIANAPKAYTQSQLSNLQSYYFSQRGEFRTPSTFSTDLALNYTLPIARASLFAQGQILNVFNKSHVNNIVGGQLDQTVRTSTTAGSGLVAFNPFTDTPKACPQGTASDACKAMGANYQFGPLFGRGLSKDAFQTPRTYRVSFGARF